MPRRWWRPTRSPPFVPSLAPESGITGYLAPEGYLPELLFELGDAVLLTHGRLVLAKGPPRAAAWVANVWRDPLRIEIASIGDAVRRLRAIQRNWALYSAAHHRRAALIAEQLPKVSAKPLVFGMPAPSAPLGSWTLLDANTLLAAASCSSPFPNGEVSFVEDRETPPSRAYLKLWELFTLVEERPRPGERCLDLGASPGGWTWVLQQLGADILSVDKAPLDPRIAALPRVEVRHESAFGIDPESVGRIDWFFSDVVCYPERLLRLVERWLARTDCRRFVCSIKFQGSTDHETARRFAAIPRSRLVHLHHNKHELTWIRFG
jgi:23S rRNA (cytidine2498-2'-O)-methyltransferase